MDIVLTLLPIAIIIGSFVYTVKKHGFSKRSACSSAVLCVIYFFYELLRMNIISDLISSALMFPVFYLIVYWGVTLLSKLYWFLKIPFGIIMIKIKRALGNNKKSETTPHMPEPPAVPVATAQPAPALEQDTYTKPIKSRYCKYCGGLLPQDSGKCLDCGKNNFRIIIPRPTTSSIIAVILAIGLTAVSVASYHQSVEIAELNRMIEQGAAIAIEDGLSLIILKENVQQLELKLFNSEKQLNFVRGEREDFRVKSDFLDENVALIPFDEKKYHKYGCIEIIFSSFWVDNIYDAKNMGYTPCATCH